MARYIMFNRSLFSMSHGERRNEYIIYDDAGDILDRLEVTQSTAAWLINSQGLQMQSAMHFYQTVICHVPDNGA